jgi:hypothetical protein
MNKKETIETQLDCKAAASLRESIKQDLEKEDKPLSALLDKDKDKDDEKSNNSN